MILEPEKDELQGKSRKSFEFSLKYYIWNIQPFARKGLEVENLFSKSIVTDQVRALGQTLRSFDYVTKKASSRHHIFHC